MKPGYHRNKPLCSDTLNEDIVGCNESAPTPPESGLTVDKIAAIRVRLEAMRPAPLETPGEVLATIDPDTGLPMEVTNAEQIPNTSAIHGSSGTIAGIQTEGGNPPGTNLNALEIAKKTDCFSNEHNKLVRRALCAVALCLFMLIVVAINHFESGQYIIKQNDHAVYWVYSKWWGLQKHETRCVWKKPQNQEKMDWCYDSGAPYSSVFESPIY
jgi:hypothetical protein